MDTPDYEKLFHELRNLDPGIYPASVKGVGDQDYEQRDAFKEGWNACVMDYGARIDQILDRAGAPWIDAERLFAAAGDIFYKNHKGWFVFLNDTWYFACADLEELPPEQYDEVAGWFRKFGEAGVLYWVYLRRGHLPQIEQPKRLVEAVMSFVEKTRR